MEVPQESTSESSPPKKKKKQEDKEWFWKIEKNNIIELDELKIYLSMNKLDKNANPIEFWKQNESRLPTLSILARQYLATPASSAPSELAFSDFGNLIAEKRNRINAAHVSQMIFLH